MRKKNNQEEKEREESAVLAVKRKGQRGQEAVRFLLSLD